MALSSGSDRLPGKSCLRVSFVTCIPLKPLPCRRLCRWLGLTAFLRVLRRKQTRYGPLLAQLQELADAPALQAAARLLAPAVDPARSSVFETILY